MTTHTSRSTGLSQCDRILEHLKYCTGQWVSMPSLAAVSGAYAVHSRIADLRKRGHIIEQRCEQDGRGKHSFYRLIKPLQK